MNLVPLVGTQIHLRKIPQELLHKVLRSPRSELVPRDAVCGTRSCPWSGPGAAGLVPEGGAPGGQAQRALLHPILPTILHSQPQVGAKTWSTGGGGEMTPFTLLHWGRDPLGARCLVTHTGINSVIAYVIKKTSCQH